jgi:hypothetical protein
MPTTTFARRTAGLAILAALAACSRNPQPATPAPQAAAATRPAAAPAATPAPAPAARVPTAAAPAAAPAAAVAPAANPAPAAARYELAGDWDWTATFQGQPYGGTLSFQTSGGTFTGVMRVVGQFDATVRTASVTGNTVRATLDSPQGEMVLEAQFTDAHTLTGSVAVLAAGEAASFSATRRR